MTRLDDFELSNEAHIEGKARAVPDRFASVLAYIDRHINEPISADKLMQVAHYSRFHFHRRFYGLFGVGVFEYIRLVRFKRAAYMLAYRKHGVLEIAQACGYENADSFSRAFRKLLGQSPTQFRKSPQWLGYYSAMQSLERIRNLNMREKPTHHDVVITDFPATQVAKLDHYGNPARLPDSIKRFIEWRKQHRFSPDRHATFNILYDDPSAVRPQDFRFGLCVAVDKVVEPNALGIVSDLIPAGRCAVLRHTGSDSVVEQSIRYLYSEWLPLRKERPRDNPLFLQRVAFFPEVPEHEAITDIFLPLA